MRIVYLCFFYVLFSLNSYAQLSNENNISLSNYKNATSVIPPSPQAAALAKYAEIPINLHTGIPSISVPLYQWKKNEMEENISISYHAGGIKVEDVASNVGTGWVLNAGGMITRSIRGLADDEFHGFINTPELYNYNTGSFSGDYYLPPPSQTTEQLTMNTSLLNIIAYFNDPNPDHVVLRNMYTGFTDTQQDLFFYNFNGFSGKFVLNKAGNVVKLDQNDLLIEVHYYNPVTVNKKIKFFTITTDHGIKYTFDVVEESQSDLQVNNSNSPFADYKVFNVQNGFYLSTSINQNTRDTIKYFYNNRTLTYFGGWSEEVSFHTNDDPKIFALSGKQTIGLAAGRTSSVTHNTINAKQLSHIRFPDGVSLKLRFTDSREDLSGDSILSGVELLEVTGISKKIKFNHSYFDAANTVTNPDVETWNVTAASDYQYKRLKLNSIKEVIQWGDVDGLAISSFQYSDLKLPPRSSKAVDYWGYYYGPNRFAYTLVPQIAPATYDQLVTEGVINNSQEGAMVNDYFMGADRTPDVDYAQAGTLRKIILPTGGSTEFNYETNSIKTAIYANSNTKITQDYKTSQLQMGQHRSISLPNRNRPEVVFYLVFKRVNQDGSLYIPPPDNGQPHTCLDGMVEATQIKFHVKSTDGLINKECSFSAVESGTGHVKVYFSLPTDKEYYFYYTHEFTPGPCFDNVYFACSTTGKFFINNTNNLVGGLRVSSVVHSDKPGAVSLKRVYDYIGNDGFVSGQIPVIPNYASTISAIARWVIPDSSESFPVFLGHAQYKSRTSNSGQTLGYTSGNVGYKKVTYKDVSLTGGTNGKKVSHYSDIEVKGVWDVFPYIPVQVLNWKSGNLLKEEIFSSEGTLLNQTDYQYEIPSEELNNGANRSVMISCIRTDESAELNPTSFCRYVARSYYPFTGNSLLTKKINTSFAANGVSMVETNDYNYVSNTDNIQTITKNNSKGGTDVTNFYYPPIYSNSTFNSMSALNMTGVQVSQRTIKFPGLPIGDFKEVSALSVDYAQFNGGMNLPKYYSALEVTSPLLTPAFDYTKAQQPNDGIVKTILSYDARGNITEEKGRDGQLISYLWSYHSTKPVIKVVGAGYADVISKLGSLSENDFNELTTDVAIKGAATYIRQAYGSSPHVQVFSYVHKSFAGISSETDGNNKTIYYEYDAFNRLILIRDTDNKILKRICYNYFGAIENCGGIIDQTGCNESNCIGPDKKCVNGFCETGQMITLSCSRTGPSTWVRVYYYKWSDNSISQQYTITGPTCLDGELEL